MRGPAADCNVGCRRFESQLEEWRGPEGEICTLSLLGGFVDHVAVFCHKQSPSNCCSVTAVGEIPASCNASWEMLSAVKSNSRRWDRHTEEGVKSP